MTPPSRKWENHINSHKNKTLWQQQKQKKQWYVTATDKFLSGWGKASGKTHKIIVVCKDFDQARKVKSNMQDDRTLKNMNITDVEPRYSSKKYTTSFIKAADAPLWNK